MGRIKRKIKHLTARVAELSQYNLALAVESLKFRDATKEIADKALRDDVDLMNAAIKEMAGEIKAYKEQIDAAYKATYIKNPKDALVETRSILLRDP